jgi:hypothetical protein
MTWIDVTSLASREVECGGTRTLVIRSLRATFSISSRQPGGIAVETSKLSQLNRVASDAPLGTVSVALGISPLPPARRQPSQRIHFRAAVRVP